MSKLNIPKDLVDAAKEFLQANQDREKAYERQDHQKAFDIELDQRDCGSAMAEWIIEQNKKEGQDGHINS